MLDTRIDCQCYVRAVVDHGTLQAVVNPGCQEVADSLNQRLMYLRQHHTLSTLPRTLCHRD